MFSLVARFADGSHVALSANPGSSFECLFNLVYDETFIPPTCQVIYFKDADGVEHSFKFCTTWIDYPLIGTVLYDGASIQVVELPSIEIAEIERCGSALDKVKAVIERRGADVNFDGVERHPLRNAFCLGWGEVVEILVGVGSDLRSSASMAMFPPIMHADCESVEHLLSSGLEVEDSSEMFKVPSTYIFQCQCHVFTQNYPAFHSIVERGGPKRVYNPVAFTRFLLTHECGRELLHAIDLDVDVEALNKSLASLAFHITTSRQSNIQSFMMHRDCHVADLKSSKKPLSAYKASYVKYPGTDSLMSHEDRFKRITNFIHACFPGMRFDLE